MGGSWCFVAGNDTHYASFGQDQTKDADSLIQALKDNGNDIQESAAEALQKLGWQSDS